MPGTTAVTAWICHDDIINLIPKAKENSCVQFSFKRKIGLVSWYSLKAFLITKYPHAPQSTILNYNIFQESLGSGQICRVGLET